MEDYDKSASVADELSEWHSQSRTRSYTALARHISVYAAQFNWTSSDQLDWQYVDDPNTPCPDDGRLALAHIGIPGYLAHQVYLDTCHKTLTVVTV